MPSWPQKAQGRDRSEFDWGPSRSGRRPVRGAAVAKIRLRDRVRGLVAGSSSLATMLAMGPSAPAPAAAVSDAAAAGPVTYPTDHVINGGVHWNRVNTATAQVYFIDHTSVRWPVSASAQTWNQTNRLGVYWRSPSQGCPGSNVGCVPVTEVSLPNAAWHGSTSLAWSGDHFTQVSIKLNTAVTTTSSQKRSVACHELGHAIGLDHQRVNDSCMTDGAVYPLYPNGHDFDKIKGLYDH